jgi:hypothetical protein
MMNSLLVVGVVVVVAQLMEVESDLCQNPRLRIIFDNPPDYC